MRSAVLILCVAFGVASFLTAASCIDATHDAQVQALGGEAPGVPPGPYHRPGQPCLLCHGEAGPASGLFSVAGTVYGTQGQTAPAVGANVILVDSQGRTVTARTNAVGNFYLTPSSYAPAFPMKVTVQQGMSMEPMLGIVGRDGSCGACHANPPGPTSTGPVYLNPAAPTATPTPEAGP
jgi:hypothetical protein